MFGIGFQELVVVLLICLLLFGASRLPEIGRALGRGIQEFKKTSKENGNGENGNKKGNDEQKS